ncbi:oxidoreductase [Mycena latifolia]|nr:oxidoreductase [Mycena latifolia]
MFGKSWNPDGLASFPCLFALNKRLTQYSIYITGGSTGLGLSAALILVRKGAHVSIVARNQEKLDKAVEAMEACRQHPNQLLTAYSFSLSDAAESAAALEAVCKPHGGRAPDAVFACAGSSKPMFFMDMTPQDMTEGMINGYWVQAWTAMAAAKKWCEKDPRARLFSFLPPWDICRSLVGPHIPPQNMPFELCTGLADTLQSEFMLYDIDVHIFFPPTMFTPGFDEENKTKPKIVRESRKHRRRIDRRCRRQGYDTRYLCLTLVAANMGTELETGVQQGHAHITGDIITSLFRASTRGAAPRHNIFLDTIYDMAAAIIAPIWRMSVDKRVRAHRVEHQQYLHESGFFS